MPDPNLQLSRTRDKERHAVFDLLNAAGSLTVDQCCGALLDAMSDFAIDPKLAADIHERFRAIAIERGTRLGAEVKRL